MVVGGGEGCKQNWLGIIVAKYSHINFPNREKYNTFWYHPQMKCGELRGKQYNYVIKFPYT